MSLSNTTTHCQNWSSCLGYSDSLRNPHTCTYIRVHIRPKKIYPSFADKINITLLVTIVIARHTLRSLGAQIFEDVSGGSPNIKIGIFRYL